MRFASILFFLLYSLSFATPTSNEGLWGGTEVGSIQCISSAISNRVVTPGMSNVIICKSLLRNQKGADTTSFGGVGSPAMSAIRYSFWGTAVDSDYAQVRLHWNTNGDDLNTNWTFRNTYIRSTNNSSVFNQNYSPKTVQNKKAVFGFADGGANEMRLYHGWLTDIYLYLIADFSTNLIDKGTVKITVPIVNLFWQVSGGFWDQNMNDLTNVGELGVGFVDIHIEVTATRFKAYNVPLMVQSGVPFSITIKAEDGYGNVDKDFSGGVYLIANGDPTAILPYTQASPYPMTPADQGVVTINNIRLVGGSSPTLTVSDGLAGLTDYTTTSIGVVAPIDRFKMTEALNPLPLLPTITAGQPLSITGITNIRVTGFDYLDLLASNFSGQIYFESSAGGWADSFPASAASPYTFVSNVDLGVKNFNPSNFYLTRRGLQNLKVTDGSHKGEWLDITVQPGAYGAIGITAPTESVAGVAIPITLRATDIYSNELDSLATRTIGMTIASVTGAVNASRITYPTNVSLTAVPKSLSGSERVVISDAGRYCLTFFDTATPAISNSVYVTVTVTANELNKIVAVNNRIVGSSASADLYYTLRNKTEASVTVTVYDLYGRKVYTFESQSIREGDNRLRSWDGKNSQGKNVSTGKYQVVITGDGIVQSRSTIVVVR